MPTSGPKSSLISPQASVLTELLGDVHLPPPPRNPPPSGCVSKTPPVPAASPSPARPPSQAPHQVCSVTPLLGSPLPLLPPSNPFPTHNPRHLFNPNSLSSGPSASPYPPASPPQLKPDPFLPRDALSASRSEGPHPALSLRGRPCFSHPQHHPSNPTDPCLKVTSSERICLSHPCLPPPRSAGTAPKTRATGHLMCPAERLAQSTHDSQALEELRAREGQGDVTQDKARYPFSKGSRRTQNPPPPPPASPIDDAY